MKHARIAWQGAIHRAIVQDDNILRLADGRVAPESEVVWLPPAEIGTAFALGLNYADHAAELSFKAPEIPLVFLKGPNTFVGHRAVTRRPEGVASMHYECELAVIIGRGGKHIRRENAYDHIAGYSVANDYAVRDYLENWYRPNLRVKNRDNCTPIGPWMVDRDDVPDPMALSLRTRINGKTVQQGTTADMIFDIPFLVEYLSEFMTLSPGDVILTGTPEGLAETMPGDIVETEIDSVGCLVNRIVGDAGYFSE